MKKNKYYTFSRIQEQRKIAERDATLDNVAGDIIFKEYEQELKKEFPDATLSELKQKAISKHKEDFDDIRNRVIAPLHHEKLSDIIMIGKESVILSNNKSFNVAPKYIENTRLPDIYNNLGLKKGLFDLLEQYGTAYNNTSKKQSGSQLIRNVQAFDRINYSYTTVKASQPLELANEAYEFFKGAKQFMAYDLETLGGTDEYGYKRVDGLTEFAYGIYDKELNASKKVNTIIGLSKEEEKRYRELIKNVNKDGIKSGEMGVIYNRIGLYGHKDTRFLKDKDGMYYVDKMAHKENNFFSDADIERGFNKLRQIYDEQVNLGTSPNGLLKWQQRFAEMIGHMNDESLSVIDYNGIIADRPWINKFLATMNLTPSQQKEFMKIAKIETMGLDTSSKRFYDMLPHARYAVNNVGTEAYYQSDEAKSRSKGFSPLSQEGITRSTYPDAYNDGSAHTAGFDTDQLAKLAVDKTGFGMNGESFMDKIYKDANQTKSSVSGTLRGNNLDLVMANQSIGGSPLSYVYDPINKIYRTSNQFAVDGSVKKEFTRENAVKRGRLYTLGFAGKLDMTEDWIQGMNGIHDEYAQNALFAIRLNPVFDEKIAGAHQGLRGHSVMLFNSEDQMKAMLSNMLKIGERDDVTSPFRFLSGEAGEEVKELLTTYNIIDGELKKVDVPKSIEDVIKKATYADINDSAARMIREDSYSKAMNFSKLYNKLTDFNGSPVDKKQASKIMLEMMQSKDRKLSKKVASGKTLTLSYSDVQEALGFSNDNGKTYSLIQGTFNNQMTAFDYMASQNEVFQEIKNHFYENNYDENQMQFKFEKILNTLMEEKANAISSDPKSQKEFWHNGTPTAVFGKDKNFFNFDTRDFFNEKAESKVQGFGAPIVDEDILRVDLGPGKEYDFVQNLVRRNNYNYADMTASQKNNEGLTQLRKFIAQVKESGTYGDLFESFDDRKINSYQNADMFGNSIIQELRRYRENNPTHGYITEAYTQDATISSRLLTAISSNKEQLLKDIKRIDADLPTLVQVNGDTNLIRSHASSIVNNILSDDIDPFQYSKKLGLSDAKAKYFQHLYGQAKEEYTDFITEFLDAFTTGSDISFEYNESKKTFSLLNASKKAIPIELPKLKAMDGNFFIDMGSNKIALHSVIDGSRSLYNKKYDPKDVKVITSLGRALNESMGRLNFYKVAKKGESYNDILRRSQSVLQNIKENIRKGSSVDANDILDIQTPYYIDYSDVTGLASLMKQSGLLQGRKWRDKDFVSKLKLGKTFDKTSDSDRQLIQKNIPELLRIIAEQKGGFNEDSWIGLIAKNLSFLNKESQVSQQIGIFEGIEHKPGVEMISNSRPVINQTRDVLYRTSEWENAIASSEFKGRNIGLKPVTTSLSSEAILNRTLSGVGRTSAELQVGKLNISEINYRAAITDHFYKKGELTSRQQKVFNKLKSVNLTEQEQVVDPRIAKTFFNRMQEQKISDRKQLSFYMNINEQTMQTVNEIRQMEPIFTVNPKTNKIEFSYGLGVNKKRHDKLFDIKGYDSDYAQLSKVTGKFNKGFFTKTDGILLSEEEINKMMLNFSSVDEAKAYLANNFDERWYVKQNNMLTFKKFINGSVEKGMGNILISGLGETDETIKQYISLTSKKHLGSVLDDEVLHDEIISKFDKKIGAQFGIKSKKHLRDLIYKEQYEAFDILRDIFGKEHDFGLIANHAQKDHKNIQLGFEELVGTMKYHLMNTNKDMDENAAMQKVFDDLTDKDNKFGGKFLDVEGVSLEDGVIKFPNHLEGGKDNYNNKALENVLNSPEYSMMKDGLKVQYEGVDYGRFVMSSIAEARDAQWMSGKKDSTLIDQIVSLREKSHLAKGEEKEYLEEQIKSYMSAYDWNTKGQKITDREIQLLDMQRYDQDLLELMGSKLDNNTIEEVMGHTLKRNADGSFVKINGQYVFENGIEGTAMLSGMSNSYREKYMRGQGGTLFDINNDNIDKLLNRNYIDEHVRDGIRRLVASEGSISKDTAEHLYSTSRGIKAVKFNNSRSLSVEAMQKEGFVVKKASDIYNTITEGRYSIDHPDSIFNKNMIIDFGDEFSESERFVALPYVQSRLTGDTVVRENFQKKLTSTLSAYNNIDNFNKGLSPLDKTKHQLKANFRAHQLELKEEIQLFSATGKNGNMGNFNVRLDQSFVSKASGVVALNPLEILEISEKAGSDVHIPLMNSYDRILAKAGGDHLKALEFMNPAPLATSKFMNKSVLQHYSEKKYLNVAYTGLEAFEEMGLFSDAYLKKSGFKDIDALKAHLATDGIVVNAIRTPSIKLDSTSPAMLYLDDTLKGRIVKTLLEPSLARTEDYDGDQPIFSVFKDINGEDSIIAKNKGHQNNRVWKDIQANMVSRSIGTHQYFHDKLYETLFKDAQKSFQNGSFLKLTNHSELDGRIFAEYNIAPTSEGIQKNSEILEEIQELYNKKHGSRFDLSIDKDLDNVSNLIKNISDTSTREKYLKAAAFDHAFLRTEVGANSKVRKTAIGEVNLPLARLRNVAALALPKVGKDASRSYILQKAFEDIEQEVISAKKGSVRDYYDKTSSFKTALNDLTSGNAERKALGRDAMKSWLDKNMDGSFQKSFKHLQSMNKTSLIDEKKSFESIRDIFIETVGSFDSEDFQKLRAYDALGSATVSYGLKNFEDLLSHIPNDETSIKNKGLLAARKAGLIDADLIELEKLQKSSLSGIYGKQDSVLLDGNEVIEKSRGAIRESLSEMAESMRRGVAELSSSKLGLASVGLAAAYMITGFVGSNASQPADLQAQAAAQEQNVMPRFSDYGSAQQNSTPANNGYVINIRGSGSPKSIARSQQSISQSMSNSIDGNINVKMNIIESDGNINDRYLDQLLVDAIGR